jgi:hypothetical protein
MNVLHKWRNKNPYLRLFGYKCLIIIIGKTTYVNFKNNLCLLQMSVLSGLYSASWFALCPMVSFIVYHSSSTECFSTSGILVYVCCPGYSGRIGSGIMSSRSALGKVNDILSLQQKYKKRTMSMTQVPSPSMREAPCSMSRMPL